MLGCHNCGGGKVIGSGLGDISRKGDGESQKGPPIMKPWCDAGLCGDPFFFHYFAIVPPPRVMPVVTITVEFQS